MATQISDEVDRMPSPDSAEQFFEAVLSSNPFERNRASDPSQMDCDVTSIHAAPFARLTELAEEALKNRAAKGALLLGNAGTGKSHLLGRLSSWAAQRQASFVFLHNIQVRPNDMHRYLLKCCISRLTEDRLVRLDDTPLFRVVEAAIRKGASEEQISKINRENFPEACQRIARRLDVDFSVFSVLFRLFFFGAKAAQAQETQHRNQLGEIATLAVRWLKGELLDAEEARRLAQRVRPAEEVAELGDDQVEMVLLTIARLSSVSGRPFVLCIDQADNMQEDQLSALCRSLHSLIDHAQNMLVVLAGVHEDLLKRIELGVIHAAAADRLNHTQPLMIRRIKRPEARLLLRERLMEFLSKCDPLSETCKPFFQNDDLFPLGSRWFEDTERESLELRPRDVLTWANERWREIQSQIRGEGGEAWLKTWDRSCAPALQRPATAAEVQAAVDRKVADKLAEAIANRRLQPGQLPADAGNLLGLATQLLAQCLPGRDKHSLVKLEPLGKRRVDLIVHETVAGRPVQSHIQFVVTANKWSATSDVRKLLQSPGADRRILVTDHDRMPLQMGARGEEYLAALEQLGPHAFTHIALAFEQYAHLDALMSVAGEARSGDLEIEVLPGRIMPITEEQVIDCYHRRDHYRQNDLLQAFLSDERRLPQAVSSFPPRDAFRAFILWKLGFLMGANLIELTRSFLASQPPGAPSLEECLGAAKEIVLEMHNEELVSAKPWGNDLYLTIGKKA